MSTMLSALQQARSSYQPGLPAVFGEHGAAVSAVAGDCPEPETDRAKLKQLFPHGYGLPVLTFAPGASPVASAINVGVIFSGGQAPGGHNVIAGLYDGLQSLNPGNKLEGFLGGPSGLIDNECRELTAEIIKPYRNTGGFDLIGSGRTKLEKTAQFDQVRENCRKLGITALVIIGGDDSNTNACVLAEYYAETGAGIQVIGCPKTIDGDLKNSFIETSFGFDTATKVYSELIGNIERDTLSARKYWHFIRLMGRSASQITLECALQTHPNITLISEEVAAKKQTVEAVVDYIAGIVAARAEAGMNFGVVLVPEGLLEFIPEMKQLIGELNELMSKGRTGEQFAAADLPAEVAALGLSERSVHVFLQMPNLIRDQLVLDRDPHGNVRVSQIETERLLGEMVAAKLKEGKKAKKFSALNHFFGYEGRCAAPGNFDADYAYSLGYTAAALIGAGKTGYICSIRNLTQPAAAWTPGGVPIASMLNIERRKGEEKAVIRKALVELDGKPYAELAANRERWALENDYVYPGPIQYFGPAEVCNVTARILQLERG